MAPKPENLPLYFNRMVMAEAGYLLIHSATATMLRLIIAGIPDQRFNEIPLAKNITRKPRARRNCPRQQTPEA